jgi:hypothetical protein
MSDIFSSDLNPEYTYDASSSDHPHFKKKVVKGKGCETDCNCH